MGISASRAYITDYKGNIYSQIPLPNPRKNYSPILLFLCPIFLCSPSTTPAPPTGRDAACRVHLKWEKFSKPAVDGENQRPVGR